MKRALIAFLQIAAVVHAETPDATSPVDARKTAASSAIRIEKPDGALVATGVLVTADGYFLTKASEVLKVGALSYRLPDNTVAKAREVRRSSPFDLVLGQVLNVAGLTPVRWSESKSIALGQWLLASKQGGRETRFGVMSARRRTIGGAGAAMGVLMDTTRNAEGVRIIAIGTDSPAESAGLKRDDVLLTVGGEIVKAQERVKEVISRLEPGEEIEVQYRREGKESRCVVRLASRNHIRSNWDGEDYANGGISIRTDSFQEIIQHDIPLGPADMGGPLFNLLGQAVGINIARVDRVTTFALPMEIFWPSVQQWIAEDRHPPKAEPAAPVAKPTTKL